MNKIMLAEHLSKSYNMVLSYTSNKRQPSLPCLYEIARILEVDVKELIVSNK